MTAISYIDYKYISKYFKIYLDSAKILKSNVHLNKSENSTKYYMVII